MDKNKEFISAFSSAVNMMQSKDTIKTLAIDICNDHPTLQQNKMRLIVEMLKCWDRKCTDGNYDLRSEATCKLAAEILEKVDPDRLIMPYI
jgi:hypothetical protein